MTVSDHSFCLTKDEVSRVTVMARDVRNRAYSDYCELKRKKKLTPQLIRELRYKFTIASDFLHTLYPATYDCRGCQSLAGYSKEYIEVINILYDPELPDINSSEERDR